MRCRGHFGFVLKTGLQVPSLVKSIQRGTITLGSGVASNTATINAVSMGNAVLRWLGQDWNAISANNDVLFCRLEFTNSTTITASRTGTASTAVVSYEVIEYVPGIIHSIQRGTITTGLVGTATITAVNPAKSVVDYLGLTADTTGDFRALPYLALTDATTVTATSIGDGVVTNTIGYQVVEWN